MCWHRWSKWETQSSGKLMAQVELSGRNVAIGEFLVQHRKCTKCGKVELDSQRAYYP